MGKLSNQHYFIKQNGSINLGRFPSKHIQDILKSGSIAIYYSTDNPSLVEHGVPGGILFFSIKEGENNPLYIDKEVLEAKCLCKVNVFRKKNNRYVMKIKAIKGGDE